MALGLDIKGLVFGRLTVLKLVPEEDRKNAYNRREWICSCSCGNTVQIEQRNLTGKKYSQQSCGCIRVKAHFIATTKSDFFTMEYLDSFNDFEKFSFLHKQLVKQFGLKEIEEGTYKKYIEKFYNENQFNSVYNFWKKQEKESSIFYDWSKPSIDHIVPKSRGGDNSLENLQFLTVFENLSKRDMTMKEWNCFKERTNTKSSYFIDEILENLK